MKTVRWLGAFGKGQGQGLAESLAFELSRPATDEVCAEGVIGLPKIRHARIGLLVAREAVIKRFRGDVWSVYQNGKLTKTRKPKPGGHTECWCHPIYKAVVIDMYTGYSDGREISSTAMRDVENAASAHGLKVIVVDEKGNWKESPM